MSFNSRRKSCDNKLLYFFIVFIFCTKNTCGQNQTIDSFKILESLTEFALLAHHPQSVNEKSENMTESFSAFVQQLQSQNFSSNDEKFNCSSSSLSVENYFPDAFCQDGPFPKCLSVNDMLELVPPTTKSISEALARLCPVLLLQLHSDACTNTTVPPKAKLRPSTTAVWGYGLLFVTLISCCSLVGVVILPLLSKRIYTVVLMLFEGLAVGSLAGSSLFHLIPQTFQLVGQDVEHGYLWKSLIIFGGIYLFYLSERFMKIIIDVKDKKKRKKRMVYDVDSSAEYIKSKQILNVSSPSKIASDSFNSSDCKSETLLNGALQIMNTEKLVHPNGYVLVNGDNNGNHAKEDCSTHNINKVASGHHHHEHSVPFKHGQSEIGTVAWMIIFGDGLHNFIDGLSIGAAFSESILAGVSISVAVLCEEFPHELGDFAVLLGAGMTMRQALLYNFLSAITCYVGLVFGILLGDLAEGAPYVFALAAGMFLYISLVDMLGELGEVLEEARQKGIAQQLKVFLIQNIGILLGMALLFVMARYAEHFNFESLTSSATSEDIIDDQVKALYSGLQEAKYIHTSLTGT